MENQEQNNVHHPYFSSLSTADHDPILMHLLNGTEDQTQLQLISSPSTTDLDWAAFLLSNSINAAAAVGGQIQTSMLSSPPPSHHDHLNVSSSMISRNNMMMMMNNNINEGGDQFYPRDINMNSSNKQKGKVNGGNHQQQQQRSSSKKQQQQQQVPPRIAFHTRSSDDILDDGYKWRKYGQKAVKNNAHPRSYYRCTHHTCNVKKQIQRLSKDTNVVVTTYEGIHNHPCEKLMETLSPLLKQLQFLSRF